MHVLQWIAIEAEAPNEAIDLDECKLTALQTVRGVLEDMLNDEYSSNAWFDWFVAGGGRWNVDEGDDFAEAYKDKPNMVIHAGTEPDLFEERILLSMEARKAEFDRYASEVKPELIDKVISSYNPREQDYSYFSDLYSIKKVIDMAYGVWDFNSYFYDIHNDSVTPKYTFEGIDKEPNSWYLIPVDFHF